MHDLEVVGLAGGLEGEGEAKAIAKGQFFLEGVPLMDFVGVAGARAIAMELAYEVAAVGGGVDDGVGRTGGNAAFEDDLEGFEGFVVLFKGEVIDKEDEFLGGAAEAIEDAGQGGEVGLRDFDEA